MRKPRNSLILTSNKLFWSEADCMFFSSAEYIDNDENHSVGDYTILESHWEGKNRDQVNEYLDMLSEKIFLSLYKNLNTFHQLEFSPREWRILIANWLFHAIHTLYDRYLFLETIKAAYGAMHCKFPVFSPDVIPRTVIEFKDMQACTDTSLILIGCLAQEMGFDCDFVDAKLQKMQEVKAKKMNAKSLFVNLLLSLQNFRLSKSVIFLNAPISFDIAKKLRVRKINLPSARAWRPKRMAQSFNIYGREKLFSNFDATDDFQKLLKKYLPFCFPASFFEDFMLWRTKAASYQYKRRPQVIFTSHGLAGDEIAGWFIVDMIQRGCQLVGIQHGGGYGTFQYCPEENHETKCCDQYITWGWSKLPKQLPASSLHLNANIIKQHSTYGELQDALVLVTTDRSFWTHRIQSHPLTGQMDQYYSWQERFYIALPDALQRKFYLKPYGVKYNAKKIEWWEKHKVSVIEKRRLLNMYGHYKLFVFDHNATGYLESLSANIPTIIFWDERLWDICKEAVPYFKELHDVGIFHRLPEAAAFHITQVWNDLLAWWESPEVQLARQNFCNNYTKTNKNWLCEWSEIIRKASSVN